MDVEGNGRVLRQDNIRELAGKDREKSHNQDSRHSGRDSNREPLVYKTGALSRFIIALLYSAVHFLTNVSGKV
jgi:hypothetical protein